MSEMALGKMEESKLILEKLLQIENPLFDNKARGLLKEFE